MKRRAFLTTLGLAVMAALPYTRRALAQAGAGWTTLFDGKSLNNWTKIGTANWRLEDGVAVADQGNGFLVSKNSYKDFELKAEFWVDDDANSGIFIRCADPAKVTGSNAYEVNIWDRRPDPTYGTGAIVDLAKVSPMPKAAGRWNTYEITARGDSFTVKLNGEATVQEAHDSKFSSGYIALQHGLGLKDANGVENDKGVVKFRRVEIKSL